VNVVCDCFGLATVPDGAAHPKDSEPPSGLTATARPMTYVPTGATSGDTKKLTSGDSRQLTPMPTRTRPGPPAHASATSTRVAAPLLTLKDVEPSQILMPSDDLAWTSAR